MFAQLFLTTHRSAAVDLIAFVTKCTHTHILFQRCRFKAPRSWNFTSGHFGPQMNLRWWSNIEWKYLHLFRTTDVIDVTAKYSCSIFYSVADQNFEQYIASMRPFTFTSLIYWRTWMVSFSFWCPQRWKEFRINFFFHLHGVIYIFGPLRCIASPFSAQDSGRTHGACVCVCAVRVTSLTNTYYMLTFNLNKLKFKHFILFFLFVLFFFTYFLANCVLTQLFDAKMSKFESHLFSIFSINHSWLCIAFLLLHADCSGTGCSLICSFVCISFAYYRILECFDVDTIAIGAVLTVARCFLLVIGKECERLHQLVALRNG